MQCRKASGCSEFVRPNVTPGPNSTTPKNPYRYQWLTKILSIPSMSPVRFYTARSSIRESSCQTPPCHVLQLIGSRVHVLWLARRLDKISYYYEARHGCTNKSETFLLCDRCACNWQTNSRRILVCNWTLTESTLWRRPNYTKQFLPESPVQQMSCAIGKVLPNS